jgi:hypothetical protein
MAVTLYQHQHFGGDSLFTKVNIPDLRGWNFNDRTSSLQVTDETATVYEDIKYGGAHRDLRPGNYNLADLERLGINNDTISSIVV